MKKTIHEVEECTPKDTSRKYLLRMGRDGKGYSGGEE